MTALFIVVGLSFAFNGPLSVTTVLKVIFMPFSSDFFPLNNDGDKLLKFLYYTIIGVYFFSYLVSTKRPKTKLNSVAAITGVLAVLIWYFLVSALFFGIGMKH